MLINYICSVFFNTHTNFASMIIFFKVSDNHFIAVESEKGFSKEDKAKLIWLFRDAEMFEQKEIEGFFIGPRKEMITPWSTNAVEITQNMGIDKISRIEEYFRVDNERAKYDPMLQVLYHGLDQEIFHSNRNPEPIVRIDNISEYNEKEGLALSKEEIQYL